MPRRRACGSSCGAEQDGIVLVVDDDGRGMPEAVLNSSQGIRGMRERALLVGAKLSIDSRPGNGTVVRLAIAR
jgi:two-component system sensor histidine kinase UhpB